MSYEARVTKCTDEEGDGYSLSITSRDAFGCLGELLRVLPEPRRLHLIAHIADLALDNEEVVALSPEYEQAAAEFVKSARIICRAWNEHDKRWVRRPGE